MAIEVLPPQDLLAARFNLSPAPLYRRKKNSTDGSLTHLVRDRPPKHNRKKSPRPEKKSSNVTAGRRGTNKAIHCGTTAARKDEGHIMGQVVLLRRGENLDSIKNDECRKSNPRSSNRKPVLGTNRIEPEMVRKQLPISLSDVYAGSGFVESPSPRSVPLPYFLSKKQHHSDGGETKLLTPDLLRLRID